MMEDIFEVELLNAQSRNYVFVRADGSFRIVSKKSGKEKITFGSDCSGYKNIRLFNKMYRAHRIIAGIFIDNPDNKPQINHIDGNKSNNSVENLEWVTSSENNQHAYDTGLAKQSQRIYIFYNKTLNITERLTQYQLRTKYNLNQGNLHSLCSGKLKSHAGWRCLGCYI